MGFLAKASALFRGLQVSTSYHQALQVPQPKDAKLKFARRDIRSAIRAAAATIQLQDRYWEQPFAVKAASSRPIVNPKFFTQGSCAYQLLVDPCHSPPQQLDLDDGMYVIVDYLQNGRPALIAQTLFELVETALRPLCSARGWTLNTSKNTCVRVELDRESHVDIPIYSAPREIVESLHAQEVAFADGRLEKRDGRQYAVLPSDKIMLAHRDGGWQQSDPLQLQQWVDGCVQRYGEDFRRACRYLKGWRDYQWRSCCLSSITIMVAVQHALEELRGSHSGFGDDRLVYEVAQRLPEILARPLENPVFPGQQVILNDWGEAERTNVIAAARALADNMDSALKRSADSTLVVEALRKAFGERIPYRPDMVEILPPATAAVMTAKPAKVPTPLVTRSTSG
jgi:hypothetical protein